MTTFADYNEFIQRELVPDIVDTVIYPKLEPWKKLFGIRPSTEGGDRITSRYRVGFTSNAGATTKADVYKASATQTNVKPYWTKLFYDGAGEVHQIDISNAASSSERSKVQNMIGDQLRKETESMTNVVVSAFLAQILADVDSSGTAYSDASLSRSTYTTLASYEEETDATITLAYARGLIQGVTQGKPVALRDYICLCDDAVYNTWQNLAAALHTWNKTNVNYAGEDMGYAEMASFERLAIADPQDFYTMTTGSVFMLRRQDVNIVEHQPLIVKEVESNRHSTKLVPFWGINLYVDNPYYQGKLLNKD